MGGRVARRRTIGSTSCSTASLTDRRIIPAAPAYRRNLVGAAVSSRTRSRRRGTRTLSVITAQASRRPSDATTTSRISPHARTDHRPRKKEVRESTPLPRTSNARLARPAALFAAQRLDYHSLRKPLTRMLDRTGATQRIPRSCGARRRRFRMSAARGGEPYKSSPRSDRPADRGCGTDSLQTWGPRTSATANPN